MRTDTILYQLFLQMPSLLFVLIGRDAEESNDYRFTSVEVKETGFRLDGVFMPSAEDGTMYFLELQFQRDTRFYSRLFAEIFLFLRHDESARNWHSVVVFAEEQHDSGIPQRYSDLAGRVSRIHLDRLTPEQTAKHPIDLLELLVLPEDKTLVSNKARAALERAAMARNPLEHERTVNLLIQILLQKFSQLSYEEAIMLLDAHFSAIEETPFYKGVLRIGITKGEEIGEERGKKIGEERGKKIGEERGKKIGEKIGEINGEVKTKIKTAQKMLVEGFAPELVAHLMEMTLEEVRELQAPQG